MLAMAEPDAFGEFEATSLFCPRCRRATPTRKKLLLVLPTGHKYDYVCGECGTEFQVTRLGEVQVPRHCGEPMQVVRRPRAEPT